MIFTTYFFVSALLTVVSASFLKENLHAMREKVLSKEHSDFLFQAFNNKGVSVDAVQTTSSTQFFAETTTAGQNCGGASLTFSVSLLIY